MSMLKPALFALSMMLLVPVSMTAQATEITLIPGIKLQIGERDNRGHYWDGNRWRDQNWWRSHYKWRENRWHRYDVKPRHPPRYGKLRPKKHHHAHHHPGPGRKHH